MKQNAKGLRSPLGSHSILMLFRAISGNYSSIAKSFATSWLISRSMLAPESS